MLEGYRQDSQQTIKLWAMGADDIQRLIGEIEKKRDLVTCHNPQCGCSMYIRAVDSKNIVTHFARYPKTGDDKYHPTRGESPEHQKAKEKLAQWLMSSYPYAEITTEYITGNQRVDVFVQHRDGKTEAHEIQRTPQRTWRTKIRTEGYLEKGIDDVIWWWLDGGNEERSREWCVQNCNSFGIGKSIYTELMGHRVLEDIIFQRYNCAAIRESREKKAAENRARREAANTLFPKRSSLNEPVKQKTEAYILPVIGKSYPVISDTRLPGWPVHSEAVVATYRFGPRIDPPWIEVQSDNGKWFEFVQHGGRFVLVPRHNND